MAPKRKASQSSPGGSSRGRGRGRGSTRSSSPVGMSTPAAGTSTQPASVVASTSSERQSRSSARLASRASSGAPLSPTVAAPVSPVASTSAPAATAAPGTPSGSALRDAVHEEILEAQRQALEQSGSAVRGLQAVENKTFELEIVQQPRVGAVAGTQKVALGRLPLVPAPVVRLVVRDESGQVIDDEPPYLVCSCLLVDETGEHPISPARSDEGSVSSDSTLSPVVGKLVCVAQRIQDLQGHDVYYFVFEDISIRVGGTFRLEFRLAQALPTSTRLAQAQTDTFSVVSWEEYPGIPVEEIATDLSRHLHGQGIPLYFPPLTKDGLPLTSEEVDPEGANPEA